MINLKTCSTTQMGRADPTTQPDWLPDDPPELDRLGRADRLGGPMI